MHSSPFYRAQKRLLPDDPEVVTGPKVHLPDWTRWRPYRNRRCRNLYPRINKTLSFEVLESHTPSGNEMTSATLSSWAGEVTVVQAPPHAIQSHSSSARNTPVALSCVQFAKISGYSQSLCLSFSDVHKRRTQPMHRLGPSSVDRPMSVRQRNQKVCGEQDVS